MRQASEFWEAVERIRRVDDRYAAEAYGFVMQALDHTTSSLGVRRHVSAAELVAGLCAAAGERFGMLGFTVLDRWGIRAGSDVGEIVFQLIEVGFLTRREEDTREEFEDVGDLRAEIEDRYFDSEPA